MFIKKLYGLIILFGYTTTHYAHTVIGEFKDIVKAEVSVDWIDIIMGPIGALGISVAGLYVTYRAILYLQKQNLNYVHKIEELYEKRLLEKDSQIHLLQQQLDVLRTQLNRS